MLPIFDCDARVIFTLKKTRASRLKHWQEFSSTFKLAAENGEAPTSFVCMLSIGMSMPSLIHHRSLAVTVATDTLQPRKMNPLQF